MTKRAILWCGQVREPTTARNEFGQLRQVGDPFAATDDASIQCNSMELAFRAAISLGVSREEIHACVLHDDLLPRNFDPRCEHRATVEGLRRLVRGLARRGSKEDALLFIAANHCSNSALATADPVDAMIDDGEPERLTPEVLGSCLSQLPGAQVIVVATCHAGIFLPLAERENCAVLAACAADKVYLVSRLDCKWPAFLDEFFGAWCACTLSDAIPRTRLSLDEAFSRAVERLAGEQPPIRAGTVLWPG